MHETTLRVFSALRERTRDEDAEDYHTLNDVAQDAGLTLDETADALERLVVVDAVEATDDDEMAYRPREVTVGAVADRLEAIHDLPDDHRAAVLERLRAGDIDPESLVALVDALGFDDGDAAPDADSTAETDPDASNGRGVTLAAVRNQLSRLVPGL